MSEDFKWWEAHDPAYDKNLPKWVYTDTVYKADVDTLRTNEFLVQKTQGEHKENFNERMKLASFVPLFSAVVDAYVGRMVEAEKKIVRQFNRVILRDGEEIEEEGLGDIRDTDTPAGRIWHNADGKGTNYLPLLAQVSTALTTKKVVWGITEGVRKADDGTVIGGAYLRVIQPEAVPITIEDEAGNLTMAVVRHTHNTRASVFDEGEVRERYTVYMLDGHATYEIQEREEKGASGKTETVEEAVRVDGGQGDDPLPYGGDASDPFFYYDTPERELADRILPIFRVELPTLRHPGYTLAHQNVSFFNTYSELQNKHRTCNILKLQIPYENEDDRQETEETQAAGSTVIWISPDSRRDAMHVEPGAQSLKETREWLGVMRSDFMFSALRGYEDSSQGSQRTATEAAQDAAQGEHSYLNMLAAAMDEFEMQAWKRLEQIEWPDEPDRWGQFFVERKRDFRPLDEEGEASRLKATFFGMNPVPIGTTGRTNAARRIGDLEDIEYDDDEVMMDVQRADNAAAQFDALEAELGV